MPYCFWRWRRSSSSIRAKCIFISAAIPYDFVYPRSSPATSVSIPAGVPQHLFTSPQESHNIGFYPSRSPTTSVYIPACVPQHHFLSLLESHNICFHAYGIFTNSAFIPAESAVIPSSPPRTALYFPSPGADVSIWVCEISVCGLSAGDGRVGVCAVCRYRRQRSSECHQAGDVHGRLRLVRH